MKIWIGAVLFVMTAVAACGDDTDGAGSSSAGGATSASSAESAASGTSATSGGAGGQGGGGGGSGACEAVSDCRLEANNCDTCTCLTLPVGEPTPKCNGMEVECLVDPCKDLEATCEAGKCGSQPISG